jgi:hypothetical protein
MYVDESDMDVDSDECDQIEEKDKCCVCGKFEPDAVRKECFIIYLKLRPNFEGPLFCHFNH